MTPLQDLESGHGVLLICISAVLALAAQWKSEGGRSTVMSDAAQVYTRLNERLGLNDHLLVLNVMLSKIATNLKVYGACDDVITATLALFQVPLAVDRDAFRSCADIHEEQTIICAIELLLWGASLLTRQAPLGAAAN